MKKYGLERCLGRMLLLATIAIFRCGSGLAYACPWFSAFFADPVDTPDQEGEFVEIRLRENGETGWETPFDSLYIQFEDKAPVSMVYPRAEMLVLVHDSAYCPENAPGVGSDSAGVACALLPGSLPNSRESVWRLWAGECRDSVNLPRPKAGKSLVRVGSLDEWTLENPKENSVASRDSGLPKNPSLRISEVHHCPVEPEPEWVEIYNAGSVSLPLSEFRFCERGGAWGGKSTSAGKGGDSIALYESIILTKDTLLLREYLGFRDVRLVQVSMGFLNNTAGSLSICMGESVVDSISWEKGTVACPAGFSPLTGRAENTPGYQGRRSAKGGTKANAPFIYKLSSRVVRYGGAPLRVYVESDLDVELRLLDSAGREDWKMTVPAGSNSWWQVPLKGLPQIGVAYVALSSGKFEKMVGILLRP